MEISGPGGGFGEEGAVGGISGVLQLRLLCSCSICVPLAAAGRRNNATQQAQLLPIRSRIEERLAKAEKGRMGWGKVRRRGCEEMFVRW
jgi:hypothetical protein